MSVPEDTGLLRVLNSFGIEPGALLGRGGEACVYALDAQRIIRVCHRDTHPPTVERRTALFLELRKNASRVPFAIPEILDSVVIEDRIVTIERRLPGRALTEVLGESAGGAREELVRAYLDAAARIGDLVVDHPGYGDIVLRGAIHAETFRAYLHQRATRSLEAAGAAFEEIDPKQLADALPEPDESAFVHLDAFPGNMLSEDGAITAVIDCAGVSILGDRRLDPLASVAYLSPWITPTATEVDRSVARRWLSDHDLDELYGPAERWIAAFWSGAVDDIRLHSWCREVLLH